MKSALMMPTFPVILWAMNGWTPLFIFRRGLIAFAALLLVAGFAMPVAAQGTMPGATVMEPVFDPGSSFWAKSDQTDVRLIAKTTGTGKEAQIHLGLQYDLKPGWKIYWRAPGDAGYPPTIDWTGSDNLASAEIRWPAPHRFSILGLETVGYKDAVILPIVATLKEPGKGLTAKAAIEFLICKEICIPGNASLELAVPAGPATPSAFAQAINKYEAQVPGDGKRHGLTLDEVAIETTADGKPVIAVTVSSMVALTHPDMFIEGGEDLVVGAPRVMVGSQGQKAILRALVDPASLPEGGLVGAPLTVTVVDGPRGLEAVVEPVGGGMAPPMDIAPETAPAAMGGATLLTMLGIAFLGGLILNLMPCVLPVLSLKIMGMVSHGGAEHGHVRVSFLASAMGIVFSFLVLAATAIGVKALGLAVGWGIQFQQPLFLVAMILLLTVFAANLWGLFEIILPDSINLGGLLEKRGGHDHSHSYGGHFLTGALATLLATPCSAPFLGTAVGFALARGTGEILLIFAMLGIGMAAPYLLVAVFPGMAARLPKPGAWMVKVKKLLGLALAGTAVWLLTVMTVTVGDTGTILIGAMMVAILGLFLVRPKVPRQGRALLTAALAGLMIGSFAVPLVSNGGEAGDAKAETSKIVWEPFAVNRIAQMVLEGKTVFVDVTADWCITCQVNKRLVTETGKVGALLESGAVVAMKADWTKPSDAIAAYLASFGRYGIPFNAVYGPGAPNGVPLPELLTEDEVLAAVDIAKGK